MSKITILIGLPGSGKTSYILQNYENIKKENIFDDYHETSPEFEGSVYYLKLCNALKKGEDVIISDIIYCKNEKLDLIVRKINELIKQLGVRAKIECLYFENNPEACKENVKNRVPPKRIVKEINFIDNIGPDYKIPERAKTIPVFKRKNTE
jgi:hypothetical protein